MIAGAREISCVHRGGKEVGAGRRRHLKDRHVRRRAVHFEPQFDRDRCNPASIPKGIGIGVGPQRRCRAKRTFRRNRTNAPAIGRHHRGDVDQAETERPLRKEPRLLALEAIRGKLRRSSVPGERPAIRAVRRHRKVRSVPLVERRTGRREKLARRRHVALGRRNNGLGIGYTERHQSQGSGHGAKGGADLGLRAGARRRLVRSKDDALGKAAQ